MQYAVLVSLSRPTTNLQQRDGGHVPQVPQDVRSEASVLHPVITVLRNASGNTLTVGRAEVVGSQNMDIENFENELLDFKRGSQELRPGVQAVHGGNQEDDNSIEQ